MATQKGEAAESGYGADTDQLMSSLADKLGKGARAAAVFGEPVERDGVTIIPVAKARWGFGGGAGGDGAAAAEAEAGPEEAESGGKTARRGRRSRAGRAGTGSGGGGGATVVPAGFIQITGGEAEFKPIVEAGKIAIVGTIATALVLIVWALVRPFSR